MSYCVYFPTRNGGYNLYTVLDALLDQTYPPSAIFVVDDGSNDHTKAILDDYAPDVMTFSLPDNGRDFRRIVLHYNRVLQYIQTTGFRFAFQLVLADDIQLPTNYCERLLTEFNDDKRLVVASGCFDEPVKTPLGAGRMIRDSFFRELGYRYPLSYAYENWPMFEAWRRGYHVHVFNDLPMIHLRPLGSGHNFREFGRAMYCLGYPILYVLGRSTLYFLKGQPRIGATLLGDYLFSRFRHDPMNQPLDAAFRHDTKQHFQRVMTRKIFNRSAHH